MVIRTKPVRNLRREGERTCDLYDLISSKKGINTDPVLTSQHVSVKKGERPKKGRARAFLQIEGRKERSKKKPYEHVPKAATRREKKPRTSRNCT